ncbi:hypothetical protein MRB53_035518 [Persea americana]|uniref:Uncharacterized protein n=1 Tax=Persea americana TaxID=3435 RepID=A0ACC2K551_PERAE|nr:hypothetical protein MRB53_035518 [Persea americana]
MNTKASSSTVLVAAVAWFVLVTTAIEASLAREAEALLQWKSSLQTQSLSSWAPNQTQCLWVGISCNNAGSVTQINLPNAGLQDWGPVEIAVILFVLLSPGLLFQLPRRNGMVEFGNFQTSGVSILVHTIIFFGLITIFLIAIGVHIYTG